MAGIFGARMKGAWPIPAPADPTGKALVSGVPLAPNVTTATTDPAQASANLVSTEPQWQKPNTLQTIAGIIGDSLTQWRGGQPMFAQMQALRQKAMYDAAMQQRERANKFADWQQQYDYEGAHPKPANNDTENDYNFYQQKYGKDFADKWAQFNAANIRQPDGTYMPISAGWATGGQAPSAPLGTALPSGYTIDAPTASSGAATPTILPRVNASQIRSSFGKGPEGDAQFSRWLAAHNVTVGDR
jgi:hypothetical protein